MKRKTIRAWAIRTADMATDFDPEVRYRVYPGAAKSLVSSVARDQERAGGAVRVKIVRVELREI